MLGEDVEDTGETNQRRKFRDAAARKFAQIEFDRSEALVLVPADNAIVSINGHPVGRTVLRTGDIIEELYFKWQVDEGLKDVMAGRTLSHQELKERLAQWRKSAGR